MMTLGKLRCFPTCYYNPRKKIVSLLSPLTIPNRLPSSSSSRISLSLSCPLLSHSPEEPLENSQISNKQKSNKITTTQTNKLRADIQDSFFFFPPLLSLSLSLSLSPPSRLLVRLLPPQRDSSGPLWVQSLRRAFAGSRGQPLRFMQKR
jgi:hypothetical protein